MFKYDIIALRRTLYKIAGTIGSQAEEAYGENDYLNSAYDNISKALDDIEELCYLKGWVDRNTNEVIEK